MVGAKRSASTPMKPSALSTVACVSVLFALAGCSGTSFDPVSDQASAQTTDGGASVACANIASGPFAPELIGQPFNGSEDFAFDGNGHMVGKRGNAIVVVSTSLASTSLATLPGQTYGLRYHPNGNLIAAVPGAGKLVSVSPTGQVSDLLTGLRSPNGVYVDFDGNVWITEFGASKVSRLAPDGTQTTIVSGAAVAQSANGVVLDAAKKRLFYTEYQKGKIQRIAIDTPGATPTLVATIPGAALDGMVLDSCGNVYAVDQGSSKLYRVRVDANGAAAAAPELLATFPTNVANAQFGSGAGFDPKKLYVTGNPGSVYALSLGVTGAPVPTAPAQ
jgi:sugar lactone lactonase YvrE